LENLSPEERKKTLLPPAPGFPSTEGKPDDYMGEAALREIDGDLGQAKRLDKMRKTGNLVNVDTVNGLSVGNVHEPGKRKGQC